MKRTSRHMKCRGLILSLLLSLTLITGMMPVTALSAFAAEQTEDEAVRQEIAEQLNDTSADPFAFSTGQEQLKIENETKDYPEAFDLRNVDGKNYVTPVRLQNPFGTCWGFAAIAAAETSILGDEKLSAGKTAKTMDLSEKHLVNFLFRPIDDPDQSQSGEGITFKDKNMKLTDKLNAGGQTFYATGLFSSGMGPNLEDRDIIDDAPAGTPADIYEYHGSNKSIERRFFDGDWLDFGYSSNDDWSMPEELRFTQSYSLKESYMLPSPATFVGPVDDLRYEYDPSATAAIKEQLMHKRGVEISFHADTSNPNQDPEEAQYISKNWAHYTYKGEAVNHGVCIVGWDDNYDRSNFIEGHQPPENGAWLVKNSWGSGENEFPNRAYGNWGIPNEKGEGTGFFWLSYYDMSISNPEALAFEKKPSETYYIDQYDFMPVSEIASTNVEGEVSFSNVFCAEDCKELQQITCQTATPGSKVDYEIWLLSPGHRNPQDGIKAASGSKTFELGGFHKIMLDEPVILQRDQYYSVVLTITTPDGKYNFNAPVGLSEPLAAAFETPLWVNGVINPGESYLKTGGKWHDYSDRNFRGDLLGAFNALGASDNFPIKAVSAPREDLSIQISGSKELSMSLNGSNAAKDLQITVRAGQGAGASGKEIIWAQNEGSEKVFSFTVDEKKPMRCSVKALAKGKGYITVSVPGAGTQVIRVDVKNPPAPIVVLETAKKRLNVNVSHQALYSDLKGCQIRYRIKGTKTWKKKNIGPKQGKLVLKKMKSGKAYQVQARDYTKINGKTVYGSWSDTVTSRKVK